MAAVQSQQPGGWRWRIFTAGTGRSYNVGLMLGQWCRRWINSKSILGEGFSSVMDHPESFQGLHRHYYININSKRQRWINILKLYPLISQCGPIINRNYSRSCRYYKVLVWWWLVHHMTASITPLDTIISHGAILWKPWITMALFHAEPAFCYYKHRNYMFCAL